MVKQNPMINIGLKTSRYFSCQSLYHSLSLVVIRCHSLYHSLSLVIIRCHSLYHLLSLVVIRCHSLYHLLSLVVIRCHSLYHSSVFFIDDRFSIVISIKFDSFNVKAIVTKKSREEKKFDNRISFLWLWWKQIINFSKRILSQDFQKQPSRVVM